MPDVSILSGIGKQRAQALHAAGIDTLEELLGYLPNAYQDWQACHTLRELQSLGEGIARVRVRDVACAYPKGQRVGVVKASAEDESGECVLVWFNQPYLRHSLFVDRDYVVYGRLQYRYEQWQMQNPLLYAADKTPSGILPVYPAIQGVSQVLLRSAMRQALDRTGDLPETLPADFVRRQGLCSRWEMLTALHFPADAAALAKAQRRKALEALVDFQLSVLLCAQRRRQPLPAAMQPQEAAIQEFMHSLPFALTAAQQRAWQEVRADLLSDHAMARLLQGDVGCGKTVVAFLAALLAHTAGYQTAIMAPTEVLALQHLRTAGALLGPMGVRTAHLLGNQGASERRQQLERVKNGQAHIVIGTHALFQRAVRFANLGLTIVDEQHRFGVYQRARLSEKAALSHMLVLSATPIPRTLALILYADMDVSVIDELPPGRQPVKTYILPPHRREGLWQFIRERVVAGEQAYIVCPLVGASQTVDAAAVETLFVNLREGPLRGLAVDMLHGRMPSAQKDRVLRAFAAGRTQVLVSTSVIEVGIDVPNATIMVVEDADRFGLSQLHQLRGRVGRGDAQSHCFLATSATGEGLERLKIMSATADGFEVARKDLELRGPGQFLGSMQHGNFPWPQTLELYDMPLVALARQAADWILAHSEDALSQARIQAAQRQLAAMGKNIFH